MPEHETNQDCWCNPYYAGDYVWVHRTVEEYMLLELELIGDICIDYDGNRTKDGLCALVDELRDRAYGAVKRIKQ